MKNTRRKLDYNTWYYKIASQFVILFKLPSKMETVVEYINQIQVLCLIIYKQTTFLPILGNDSYTQFVQGFSKYFLFWELVPREFHSGIIVFVLGSLIFLLSIILVNVSRKKMKVSCSNSLSKKVVVYAGYLHYRVFCIWINLILIGASFNNEDSTYSILAYIGIGLNNMIGIFSSAYSISPFLTLNEFVSESLIFGLTSFLFKSLLTLLFLVEETRVTRIAYALVSLALFASRIIILFNEHPFYRFHPLRLLISQSFLGGFFSLTYLAQSILNKLTNDLNPSYIIYFETIIGTTVYKIARSITESYYLDEDRLENKKALQSRKDRIRLMLNIDYQYSLKNLNPESRDHRLIYLMRSLRDRLAYIDVKESRDGNVVHINDMEVLNKLKNLRLRHVFENTIQTLKNFSQIRILLAEIYLELFDDYQKAIFTLEGCNSMKFVEYIKFSLLVRRTMKKYKKEISSFPQIVEIQKFVEVENHKEQLFEKMGVSMTMQYDFLKNLLNSEAKLDKILQSVKNVEDSCAEVEAVRKNLNILDDQSVEIMPYYSFYLAAVLNQPYSAEKQIKEYDTRFKIGLTKTTAHVDGNFALNDTKTIIIRFSMNRVNQGTILSVSENIKMLGWEQKDITKYNLAKLLPEFLNVNTNTLVDDFLDMNSEFELTSKINTIFLASADGFIIPADVKLFLNPTSSDQINYLAFCKLKTHSNKMIVFCGKEIVGITPKVAEDLHITSKELQGLKIQNVLECSSITGLKNESNDPSKEKQKITLKHKNLVFEYNYTQKKFSLFDKSFRILTLSSSSENLEETISAKSSSHLSERACSEDVNILAGILTTFQKGDETHMSLDQDENLEKDNQRPKTLNKTLKTFMQSKNTVHAESSEFENEMSGNHNAVAEIKKPPKKINYAESSVHSTLSSQSFKRVQSSLLFVPKKKFTLIVCSMNILLFIVSSVVLLAYYIEISKEFELIDLDLSCIYTGIKLLQMIMETKRVANLFNLVEMKVMSPYRYSALGFDIYSPFIRSYFDTYRENLEEVTKNLTSIVQGFDQEVLHKYYEDIIPIRYNSRNDIPSEYMDGPGCINRIVSSALRLVKYPGNISSNDPDLKFIILNSNDEVLLQAEKTAKLAYKSALVHTNDAAEKIVLYAIAIIVLGVLNLILLFVREKSTRVKKRHFLNILSLLDEKEITSNMDIMSDFLRESKKTHPKTIAMIHYNNFMEQEYIVDKTKKNIYNGISGLKRLSSAKLPIFEILKLIFAMIVMVLLMVLPFLAMSWAYIFAGREDKMKQYIETQFKTGYSYYELRLLIVSSFDYYAYNTTSTLRTRPISQEFTEISTRLSFFQTYLVDVQDVFEDPLIKHIISQSICDISTSAALCQTLGGGAGSRGLIGLNSFQLNVIDRIRSQFDASNRTFSDIYLAVNHPSGFISEYLDVLFNFDMYDRLLVAQYSETFDFVEKTQLLIIRIIIGFFVTNLVLGTMLTYTIQKWMNREREIWTKIVQRIPFKIAMNSKILTAYLNDHTKRNIE